MPEIYLPPSKNNDIYSFGYNKQLYTKSQGGELSNLPNETQTTEGLGGGSNDLVSNSTTQSISPSQISSGEIASTVKGLLKTNIALGDGSDGDTIIAGDLTLSSDVFYNNLLIKSGVTVTTGGYKMFAKGKFRNSGTIKRNGNNGSGGTGGAGLSKKSIGGSAAGATGGSGAGAQGGNANPGLGGAGGGGGDGTGDPAGGGGTVTASATGINNINNITTLYDYNIEELILGGAGGGSGGAGGGNSPGGGGGGGGGVIFIAADSIINEGNIQVNGGNGGNGAVNCGGGGGGGGGAIVLLYTTFFNSGSLMINGGIKGTAGSGASEATNGLPGNIYEFSLT